MSVLAVEVPGRVVMHGVSWAAYEQLLQALEQQHVRVAYDRGRPEIMSPAHLRERIKRLLGLLVNAISREFGIPIHGFGSATFRREGLERGIEADEWLYVANEAAVRGKDDVDLDVDPPPDLAIEVDVTSTIDDRLPIYWALANCRDLGVARQCDSFSRSQGQRRLSDFWNESRISIPDVVPYG
jgi:Uma2 family endonuclease